MALIGVFLITVIAFLAIDAVALTLMMLPLFQRHIGDLLRDEALFGVAAAFYVFYAAGVIYFAVMPGFKAGSLGLAVLNGALLGLIAYGTYEFSNMATLKGWAWPMVITDTLWGAVLTGTTAAIGYLAARWLL